MGRAGIVAFGIVLLAHAWLSPTCAAADPALRGRIDKALESAGGYLVSRQSDDGAWRSGVHGSFRDGTGLTPHVLTTLHFLASEHPPAADSVDRGLNFLLGLTNSDGIPRPQTQQLTFPVYTMAQTSWVLGMCDRGRHPRIELAWLARLRERQLNAANGWAPSNPEFGGWGYSPAIPRKPAGEFGAFMVDSNLSATLFAVGALRVARVPADDPLWSEALSFIDRCQNFSDDASRRDERFDDGGFYFMPGDAARNKPGAAGTDRFGRERYFSYGTMSADGVRAMLACGRPADHPRVVAARDWLIKHFDPTHNPGRFNPDRELVRESTYYYWCWSAAHAMARLKLQEIGSVHGRIDWAEELAKEVLSRQRADGSWASSASAVKEDDPLVATPFAAAALVICHDHLYHRR